MGIPIAKKKSKDSEYLCSVFCQFNIHIQLSFPLFVDFAGLFKSSPHGLLSELIKRLIIRVMLFVQAFAFFSGLSGYVRNQHDSERKYMRSMVDIIKL
jgi:hypothetical protein